ncbi:ABC transporter permease [Variovorax paradoxus]|uniref:ABC transporter permease n=1 Tax=Variovorax paradoxus TaxID=34073 RepID=UPI00035C4E4B|nr:ABC transporter permease [Variovorax paradoxus]
MTDTSLPASSPLGASHSNRVRVALRFFGSRAIKSAIVLVLIAVFNFILVRAAPGDPAEIMAGLSGGADAATLQQLRRDFGLDKPVSTQLLNHLEGVFTLDLGYSFRQQEKVATLIFAQLPATLLLTVSAFVLAVGVGILLGITAALHAGRWKDTAVTTIALLVYATPSFWIGLMLVLLFAVKLEWLPLFGYQTVGAGYTGIMHALDVGRHLLLPAVTLGLFYAAIYTRLTRASVLEVLNMDFVRTARAKGLSEPQVIRRHVLRNALLPIITFAGLQAGGLVGGAVLIETVFGWPGIGRLAFEALGQRDYNLLLGIFFVASVLVVIINMLTDVLYTLVDPRIELK